MLILTGASACGKTEIAKLMISKFGLKKLVTYTTRTMRAGEVNDVDYHFVSKSEFLNKKENNEFLETTFYNDNYYGTAFKDASNDKVVILDPMGANNFYKKLGKNIVQFVLVSSKEIRAKRMRYRGDKEKDIRRRLVNDEKWFTKDAIMHVDYIIDTELKTLNELSDEIYSLYESHLRNQK